MDDCDDMTKFKDNLGKSWSIELTVGSARRMKELISVDIMQIIDGDALLVRINRDPALVCDMLYCICKPQADERKIDDQAFGELIGGFDIIIAARKALFEEIVNFFPAEKPMIMRQMAKLREVTLKLVEKVGLKIDGVDAEEIAEAALVGVLSGNALESSE